MGDKTDLGDRMKLYESRESGRACPLLPVLARLDGKCFSAFTRGLDRPYDRRLSGLMVNTTRHLVEETGALTGFTQSDEITLLFYSGSSKSQIFLDGRFQKMCSILASMCAVYFNAHLPKAIPEKAGRVPLFDCRVWTVPNRAEAANAFLWRERDATKNSVSMAAREHYSHKQLLHKTGSDMQEMLFQKGVNWNNFPAFFKRGAFVQRREVVRRFTAPEIEKLPAKHAARSDPDLEVRRSEVRQIEMPPFGKVVNRIEVLFDGAVPLIEGTA